jgi:hypothetical protein
MEFFDNKYQLIAQKFLKAIQMSLNQEGIRSKTI